MKFSNPRGLQIRVSEGSFYLCEKFMELFASEMNIQIIVNQLNSRRMDVATTGIKSMNGDARSCQW